MKRGFIMKKSAVSLAITLGLFSSSALAVDSFIQSARNLGSGGAGLTYAHWSSAANYNPALLGTAVGTDNDFFLVLNGTGRVADTKDDGDSLDLFESLEDEVNNFEDLDDSDLLEGDPQNLQNTINTANRIVNDFEQLDGAGLQGSFGVNLGFGMAFERVAVSFNAMAKFDVGGTGDISSSDINLLRRYTDLGQTLLSDVRPFYDEATRLEARYDQLQSDVEQLENSGTATQDDIDAAQELADEAEVLFVEAEVLAEEAKLQQTTIQNEYGDIFDQDTQTIVFDEDSLESKARFAAIGWAEAGVTLASNWQLDSEKKLSVGATVKTVRLELFDYQSASSDFDEDDIDGDEYRSSKDFVTADLGAILSMDSMDKWRIGVTVKNIVGEDIESRQESLKAGQESLIYEVETQVRIGTSYNHGWIRLAADLDLTESKGPQFANGEQFFRGSQYGSVGAVINAYDFLELRAGYRHNFADKVGNSTTDESDGLITVGAGVFLGGVQFDLGLQASPELDDVGGGLQAMITW
ncbi:type IX secretion system membrane protein PorP/SprF [Psychrosphaera haliotis]|uniref:Type IX secretion system membrane protein PorP/SprF n=2 Tax=Psychrosphaera haliotis TaxID=555083 RepID=A0A6N8FCN8_9GAMM|nr:type IX secretion system membrane protein PorP/SprF [Psychrosphaera haliotis]